MNIRILQNEYETACEKHDADLGGVMYHDTTEANPDCTLMYNQHHAIAHDPVTGYTGYVKDMDGCFHDMFEDEELESFPSMDELVDAMWSQEETVLKKRELPTVIDYVPRKGNLF